jgi:hypothetical protein
MSIVSLVADFSEVSATARVGVSDSQGRLAEGAEVLLSDAAGNSCSAVLEGVADDGTSATAALQLDTWASKD